MEELKVYLKKKILAEEWSDLVKVKYSVWQ